MASRQLNHWQDHHGFPTDRYFEAVAHALDQAGITLADWDREEDWEVNYEIAPHVVQGGPMRSAAAEGLWISWRTDEDDEPQHAEDFTGLGWYYVPYSKTGALGDYAAEFPSLPYLAEPEQVAAAVAWLVCG